jgi:hypothetical protein
VAEDDINPFVEIDSVQPPVRMATCSQWYDQHIIALAASDKEPDGFYHVRAKFRFLSVPGPVAREIEKAATLLVPDAARSASGFLVGKVDDFESFIPPSCKPRDPNYDRRDVYIITQNALADATYLMYIRAHYNRSAQQDPPFLRDFVLYLQTVAMGKKEAEKRLAGQLYRMNSLAKVIGSFTNVVAPIDRVILSSIGEEHGIAIPTLCYLESLPPYAACRLCLVELTSQRSRLVARSASPTRKRVSIPRSARWSMTVKVSPAKPHPWGPSLPARCGHLPADRIPIGGMELNGKNHCHNRS